MYILRLFMSLTSVVTITGLRNINLNNGSANDRRLLTIADDLLELWSPLAAQLARKSRVLKDPLKDPISSFMCTQNQVTETDIYLLGAIEKLVERVDLLESRIRRAEISIIKLMNVQPGQKPIVQEPCPKNWTRIVNVGHGCFSFSQDPVEWKTATHKCKSLGGQMAEFDNMDDIHNMAEFIQKDKKKRDSAWWTAGFNPGLLWLWSGTARPVPSMNDIGIESGRCLSLHRSGCRPESCAKKLPPICQLNDNIIPL